jgi:hypothetical protein
MPVEGTHIDTIATSEKPHIAALPIGEARSETCVPAGRLIGRGEGALDCRYPDGSEHSASRRLPSARAGRSPSGRRGPVAGLSLTVIKHGVGPSVVASVN